MVSVDIIKDVISKRDSIPFPEQFKTLRDKSGIRYYEVDLKNKQNTYVGTTDQFVEKLSNINFSVADTFDETLIKKALDNRRNKKTSYVEFLAELAAAGVIKYRVDMIANNVTYHGKSQSYAEQIPPHLIK